MNESAERKLTALDDFVMAFVRIGRDMSVPIPVRNFATNCRDRLQEYILASSERREPPAASVSEPAAMPLNLQGLTQKQKTLVYELIDTLSGRIAHKDEMLCAAITVIAELNRKRAASVSPAPKCSCLQFAVHLDCPLHGNLPLPESDQLAKNPLQPSPVGPEPAKEETA